MIINQANRDVINTSVVNIHDYIFCGFNFDYEKKTLCCMICSDSTSIEKQTIDFFNVIGFEMIACDFWGKSPHILDWETVDDHNQVLLKKLIDEKKDNCYPYARFTDNKAYIESVITFVSGDRLTIACEYIAFGSIVGQGDGLREPQDR